MIIGIVAIAKNYAIGKGGKLPWHFSADLKFFKEMTTGKTVVMGANTWRSISKPLPNRLNVILSRSDDIDVPPEVMRLSGKDEVVDLARYLNGDVYIIGGAKTFATFADTIEKWIVTEVPVEVADADTFMPSGFLDGYRIHEVLDLGEDLVVRIFVRQ